ncbi:MAG: SUMF1/EgtB/PvdO family nonheme iron enzyme [Desulfobacteraceae bacterium]|nr:SUMF1/EgtB/PvdO family nonheme iron enzyme [Desulfobacteraceae bacterium]
MKRIVFICLLVVSAFIGNHVDAYPGNIQDLIRDARNGDVEAMVLLGTSYYHGKGVLKDPFKAKCWIKKAYDNGSQKAAKVWNDLALWEYSGKCDDSFDDEVTEKYQKKDIFTDPFTGMVFVYVPQGCFIMGCHNRAQGCRKDEKPAHSVCVDGFWMGKFEVTQAQWELVRKQNPSRFKRGSRYPVENVSFEDVDAFIQRLNSLGPNSYLLPTEAQWEYACRNMGMKINFPDKDASDALYENCGNCDSGPYKNETAPVGSFVSNDLGLYDMAGNVREWCRDVYHKDGYEMHSKLDPVVKARGASEVVRGGSYIDNMKNIRCTARQKSIPAMKSDYIGFRLVLIKDK